MFKQKLILEVKGSEERIYRLECDPSAPLGELHDAINAMKNVVVEQIKIQSSEKQPEEVQEGESKDQL